jgi:hypothetical protein
MPNMGRFCPYSSQLNGMPIIGHCRKRSFFSLSTDRDSHAATRNMMCCTVTGQGAGVAAAISVKHEQSLSDINIDALQEELCRQGVRLQ